MGDFRIPFGFALGRQNNFFARTDNLFGQSDATPDVTLGSLFFSNNTSNTTITGFDLTSTSQAGNNAGAFEGKLITVMFLDGSTRLANAAPLYLSGSDGLQGANNIISLVYHNSGWYETYRSVNINNIVTANSAGLTGTGTVDVRGRDTVVLISSAGSDAVLRLMTNGEQGQKVNVICTGSNCTIVVNSAAANNFVTSSSSGAATVILANSAALSFTRIGSQWIELKDIG